MFASNYAKSAGAINVHSSTLIFQGNVEFVNNIGYDGGALALYAGSQIVLERHAHLNFSGNLAKRFGGAIYVDRKNYLLISDDVAIPCFCKLADPFISSMNPHVVFKNNTAKHAGSAIYGGWIDFCGKDDHKRPDFDHCFSSMEESLILQLFHQILSIYVCMCINSKPECNITQHNISVHPGATISCCGSRAEIWDCAIHSLQ